MAWTTRVKNVLNSALQHANLRVGALTVERRELARLNDLHAAGHFDRPIFPVPDCVAHADHDAVLREVEQHAARYADWVAPDRNEVGYSFDNDFFSSPDAEVAYAMLRKLRPGRVVEVGSGHSTKIARMAIRDGALGTHLACIDPEPRVEVAALADEFIRARVESPAGLAAVRELQTGDVLFVDSSHEVVPGNDVVTLLLQVLPALPSGVLVHVHDIFLPFEYPASWIIDKRLPWAEQYVVQALLAYGDSFEVLWAGRHAQSSRDDFARHFPHCGERTAKSLWLRKR